MSEHIEVWLDDTSEHPWPVWCVSLCGDDGDEIKCLDVMEEKRDAVKVAKEESKSRGLTLEIY